MTRIPFLLSAGVGLVALAACSGSVEAPYEPGVC